MAKKASIYYTIKHGTCLVSIATGGGRYMYLLKYVFIEKKCNVTLLGGIEQLNNNIGNNKGQYLPLPRWYLH